MVPRRQQRLEKGVSNKSNQLETTDCLQRNWFEDRHDEFREWRQDGGHGEVVVVVVVVMEGCVSEWLFILLLQVLYLYREIGVRLRTSARVFRVGQRCCRRPGTTSTPYLLTYLMFDQYSSPNSSTSHSCCHYLIYSQDLRPTPGRMGVIAGTMSSSVIIAHQQPHPHQ